MATRWYVSSAGLPDTYDESVGVVASSFLDDPNGIDRIHTHTDSPSLPVSAIDKEVAGTDDDYFIDVEIYSGIL